MTVEQLQIIISAQTSQLKKELNTTKSSLRSVEKEAKSVSGGISKAFKAIKATVVVLGLGKISKDCIALASNLQEVQNVVDVSFGEMSKEIDAFADNALKQFGLSELAAKKMAGSFMAMSNGMGVDAELGKNMSVNLTGLSADLASFWNTTAEQAQTALNGVYTGETEALKKFGVVMSEANLKAHALELGITKQYSELSQAEKTMLRYSFVMKSTSKAQGDFARTSDGWANQLRILKGQLEQIGAVIGELMIKFLTPLVQMLNQILSYAVAVAKALEQMFGSGEQNDTELKVDANTDKAEQNLSNTTEKVEDLKKSLSLANFDAINKLGTNSADAVPEANKVNPDVFNIGEMPKFNKIEEIKIDISADFVDKWKSCVDEFVVYAKEEFANLVKMIDAFWTLTKMKVKLPDASEWAAIAENVKNGLNGIWAFFKEFFGYILVGVYELLTSIDWGILLVSASQTFENVVSIFKTALLTMAELALMFFKDIGVGELITQVMLAIEAYSSLAKVVGGIVCEAFLNFYSTALSPMVEWIGGKLADALIFTQELLKDWEVWFVDNKEIILAFVDTVAELVARLWELIEPLADAAWETFKGIISGISEIFQGFFGWILENGDWIISILEGIVAGFLAYKAALGISALIEAFTSGTLLATAATMAMSAAQAALNAVLLLNPIGLVIAAIAGLVVAFVALWNNCEGFRNFWIGLWQAIVAAVQAAWDFINSIIDGIVSAVNKAIDAVKRFFGIKSQADASTPEHTSGDNSRSSGSNFGSPSREYSPNPTLQRIPKMASGGVLTRSTIANVGEYAGASTNPEIVTPQSVMKQTFEQGNAGVINAIMAMGSRVIKAVEDKDSNVYMDGTKVTRQVMTKSKEIAKHKGTALLV